MDAADFRTYTTLKFILHAKYGHISALFSISVSIQPYFNNICHFIPFQLITIYNHNKTEGRYIMVTKFEPVKINIQLKEYLTDAQLAELMDIEQVSAHELLNGVIPFENGELEFISRHLGINIGESEYISHDCSECLRN